MLEGTVFRTEIISSALSVRIESLLTTFKRSIQCIKKLKIFSIILYNPREL